MQQGQVVVRGLEGRRCVVMAKTMKDFVNLLEERCPGELVVVNSGPLRPAEAEAHTIMYHLRNANCFPCGVFTNVTTLRGGPWDGAISCTELATWTKAAAALGLDEGATPADILQELNDRAQRPIEPEIIPQDDAPVRRTVLKAGEFDLYDLPAHRKDSKDAKPGWIAGVGVGKDVHSGRYNLSWHRAHLTRPDRTTMRLQYRHLWEYLQRYKKAGHEKMPTIWVFGHHPVFMLASAMLPGWDVDEYSFAGGIMGEPLRLTASETWGCDFLVPADAECILEGYIHCYDRDLNGPWTDFMRYYSPQTLEPILEPTALTMADKPIFNAHWTGYDNGYHDIPKAATVLSTLKRRYPRVKSVNYVGPFSFIIQFQPDHPGETTRLAQYAMGALGDLVKNVIVVDEDIDPFNLDLVFFSIATRTDAGTPQVQVFRDLWANRHDPSAFELGRVGGLMIDSTIRPGQPFPEIGHPDEEVQQRIRPEAYIPRDKLESLVRGKISTTWHALV